MSGGYSDMVKRQIAELEEELDGLNDVCNEYLDGNDPDPDSEHRHFARRRDNVIAEIAELREKIK